MWIMKIAKCHPDRKHMAREMCKPCYDRWRWKEWKPKNQAQHKDWYRRNKAKVLADTKAYAIANKGKVRVWRRAWKARNAEHVKTTNRRHHLWRFYRLTPENVDALRLAQDDLCAICHREFEIMPHVDHDHSVRGRAALRGMLCTHCNKLLGHAYESVDTLTSAIEYLQRHRRLRGLIVSY